MKLNTMPTIGILGVTIPGALDCINKMNQKFHNFFPKHEHPTIVMYQANFLPIHDAQTKDRWDIIEKSFLDSIDKLKISGANFVIIPANTAHKIIGSLQQNSSLPIISILDVVSEKCAEHGFKKVGVIGTKWTMMDHLYAESLQKRRIVEVIPDSDDQNIIQDAIFNELILYGKASSVTVAAVLGAVERLKGKSCDSIVLACTELPLILNQEICKIPVLDTTDILADAAIKMVVSLKN